MHPRFTAPLFCLALTSFCLAATLPEAEPNNAKAAATAVTMNCDDVLTGAATPANNDAFDYWNITTPAAPLGIYRYRLTLSPANFHNAMIQGLAQTDGVVDPLSDTPAQFSTTGGTINNANQWYGFGRPTHLLYRVAPFPEGNAYSATLSCQPATILQFSRTIESGSIQFTSTADAWLYDANLQPLSAVVIPGSRTLAPGVYYWAATLSNLANNQPTAVPTRPDADRPVLEFADTVVSSNFNSSSLISLRLTDVFGNVTVTATPQPYDVIWAKFEVTTPAPVACCLSTGACEFVTSAQCATDAGLLRAFGSTCDSVTCEQPRACCYPDGTCAMTLVNNCVGGRAQAGGSTCATTVCSMTGICCFANGTCRELIPESCNSASGTPGAAGGLCANVSCPALCHSGDANCDGVVNNFDIDPWIVGITFGTSPTPPAAYTGTADCWALIQCWGDMDGSGGLNNFDIDPFVACIVFSPAPGQACP